jgi:SAM-dependent methyltransferase
LLEFASGYGRVTRHLINSSANLWACDIHPAAIDFIQRDIGARAFVSSPFPEMFQAPQQFDATVVLSLFSHLPITTWTRWLVRLVQVTRPGGFIIFTTHGLKIPFPSGDVMPSTGFWFAPVSEQRDLPTQQYGCTITTPAFVEAVVDSIHGVKLINFEEGTWWGGQDQYILQVQELGGARPIKKRSKLQSYKDRVKAIGYIVLPYNKRRREKRKRLLAGLR